MMSHQQRDERIRTIKRQRGLLGTDLAQAKELACAMHGAWLGNNPWRGKDQRDPDYVAWRASRKDPRFGSYERATSLVSTLQRQIEALTQELAALQQAARKQQQARPEPNKRKEPSMPDFHLPDTRPMPGSPVARVQLNLTAIRTLRALEQSGRLPKPAELDALAAYVGWGACPQIFAGLTPEWQQYQQQLRALLSPAEYEHAQRSTTNAHYTSALVVKAIWRALERLGMQPGMNWLEPALGVGNFFGLQPAGLRGGRRIGVEKDTITGRIAQLLYPDSTVLIQPFEEAPLPENYFDAAISNVPFGDYGVYDPAFSARRWMTKSIHNYFFVKALDLVRPGGVIAFITSRYTLDGYSPDADGVRSYLAQRAELLGAFRLPDSAFEECAGTSVVTDVIFLRKRLPNARPSEEKPPIWLEAKWQIYSSAGSYVNQYFCNGHGHCVLGTPMIQRGAYTKLDYTVRGLLTAEQLNRAFETLPPGAFLPYQESGTRRPRAKPVLELHAAAEKIGGLFLERNKLYRRISAASVERVDVTGPAFQRAVSQLEIRDQLVKLLDAEREDQPTPDLDRLRQELGRLYLRFVKRFGVLSKRVNQLAIAGDPDAPLLLSLEQEYDPKAGTAHPAPILSRRVLEPVRPVTRVGSAEEALAVSLNETARVDWDRMAALTGRSAAQLQADLAGLVFEDPKTGEWETADAYLSGSVRRKLAIAKARATVEPRFAVNVKALEAAQPEDIPPGEIVALLGVSWVPLDVYGQFIQVVMNSKEPAKVCYINGEYHFNDPWTSTASKWSTADVSAGELLRDCLNQRRTKVWRRDEERSWVDQEATMAAQERQGKLHEYFNEWLLATDPVRTDAMARIYNERVNDLRLRSYDGSHLTLPGMSRACLRTGDMEPYQKAAVWRQICQTKCYIAHAVGAGKTFEAIAGAMELRRLGLIRRPMFVVPNSTLSGWQNQFQLLYPGARVIVFSERDLEASKRKATMARIATTEWDAVVVPHSSFQLIPVGPEVFQRHYNRLEQQLEESVTEAQAEGMDSRFVKRLVKQKERLLKRLLERQGKHKDNTVSWEQLAIDHLVVDEAHEYKRLGFTTKQGAVAGIDPDGNQKTFDLLMKVRYTEEHDGRIVFLSGTPATNTMGELYNAMQYLIQPELDARGLGRFDEWSAAFGQVINVFEPKPEGGGYQVKGRFARFINVPELSQLFRSFADVVTSDMLDIPRPGIAGGERQGVVNTLNPAQRIYMKKLQERAAEIRKNARAALPDCMIAIYGDAQMMALDVRMVDPSAPDHPDSRINQCAREILRQYRRSSRDRGTQLVFCDFGKPRAEQQKSKTVRRRFSAYDDLIAKLVAAGIPREQIAHIYQARNKHERSRLFRWVNAGQIRVLIGSTAKMGLGVNVQERVVAMHHLTLPHRPADLEQREGRGLRQGNRNASVAVFYYITKGSLDELKFANVARKARAFAQFMQGKSTVREMEDIDELTPSLETFQAAASGDPRVRRKLEVDNELHRLGVLQNEFRTERWKKRSALNDIPHRIEVAEKQIAALRKLAEAWDSREREWTIYDQQFTGDGIQRRAGQALENAIRRLPGHDTIAHPVGTVNGIRIFATSTRWFAFEGVAEWIDVKDMAGSGMIQSAEYFLRNLDKKIAQQQERIARAQADRTELEASLAQPWDHEARYEALRKEQAALFTALGGGKDEAGAAVSAEGAEVAAPDVEAAEVPDPIEEESDEEESDDFAEPDWPADLPEPEAVFEAVQASLAAVLDEGTETLSLFDGSFETIEIQ